MAVGALAMRADAAEAAPYAEKTAVPTPERCCVVFRYRGYIHAPENVRVELPEAEEAELRGIVSRMRLNPLPCMKPICVRKTRHVEPLLVCFTPGGQDEWQIALDDIWVKEEHIGGLTCRYMLGSKDYHRLCELVSPERNKGLVDAEMRKRNEARMESKKRDMEVLRTAKDFSVSSLRKGEAESRAVEVSPAVRREICQLLSKLSLAPAHTVVSDPAFADWLQGDEDILIRVIPEPTAAYWVVALRMGDIRPASEREAWSPCAYVLPDAALMRLRELLTESRVK